MSDRTLVDLLQLTRPPVAVKFQDEAPEGVGKAAPAASGCSYWKLAAEGSTFYTDAVDHHGCPIGSYTHGIELPPEKAGELNEMIGTMVDLKYIAMEEVPQIPQLDGPFGVAIYAPLTEAAFEPDVVIVTGNARQIMLLAEAAHASGAPCDATVTGRPTCAAIPAVMKSGGAATNLGCVGNRVYTELDDADLYYVVAGERLPGIVQHLATVANANSQLESFHIERAECANG